MQFERIKKMLEEKGAKFVIIDYDNKYSKTDYVCKIVFLYKNKLYVIGYNKDKMKGYEYYHGDGSLKLYLDKGWYYLNETDISYMHIKNFILSL